MVFVGNTFTRGNQAGGQNQAGVSTMTSLSGTAFSTDKISLDEVQALTAGKEFLPFMINKLNRNAWSPNTFNPFYESKKPLEKLTLNGFYVEDGKVMIKTSGVPQTKQQVFEVVNLESDGFITLMHRDSKVIYNYIFIDSDHEFAQAYLNSRAKQ